MVAIVGVLAVVTIAIGERIGVNAGQGWDGMSYVQWAQDLPRTLARGVDVYHAQRLLPSSLAWLAGARRVPHVIFAFQVLDAVALAGAALAWAGIARSLAWSRAAAWAGFAGVFGSFAIARHALYYPTLTDATAFALGMAMTWAFVARRPVVVACAALAACITWPALPELALVLLVLRRPAEPPPERTARWIRPVAAGIAATAAAVTCAVALHYLDHPLAPDAKWAQLVPRDVLPLTLACLAAWTAVAWYLLARQGRAWSVAAYARGIADRTLVACIAAAIAIFIAREVWIAYVGTQPGGPTPAMFACELALESLRGPLWNLVHHVVYFGPIIVIAVAWWPRVAATAAVWGPGAALAAAMIVAFAIGSESRQWVHLFPLLAALAIEATRDAWTPRRAIGFAACCLVWSKLWWPIGYDHETPRFGWPAQRYFMQQGPWATDVTFLAHLAGTAVTAIVVVVMLRRRVA